MNAVEMDAGPNPQQNLTQERLQSANMARSALPLPVRSPFIQGYTQPAGSLSPLSDKAESERVSLAPILTQRSLEVEDPTMRPDMSPPALEGMEDFTLFPPQK